MRGIREFPQEPIAGGEAIPNRDGADGTERLCRALYGRKARARDYLGGSDARMLHDAADLLDSRSVADGALRLAAQRLLDEALLKTTGFMVSTNAIAALSVALSENPLASSGRNRADAPSNPHPTGDKEGR